MYLKIIHLIETPHSVTFNYDGLVCRLKSTTDAVNIFVLTVVHTCPNFLHLYILLQVLPPELFFYCEYMSQNLTYALHTNRPFVIIRMNFIASAHNTYLFIILKRVYGISRFYEQKNIYKFKSHRCFFIFTFILFLLHPLEHCYFLFLDIALTMLFQILYNFSV